MICVQPKANLGMVAKLFGKSATLRPVDEER
jgi:hypothetical protein